MCNAPNVHKSTLYNILKSIQLENPKFYYCYSFACLCVKVSLLGLLCANVQYVLLVTAEIRGIVIVDHF